jgi:hypothetical protein
MQERESPKDLLIIFWVAVHSPFIFSIKKHANSSSSIQKNLLLWILSFVLAFLSRRKIALFFIYNILKLLFIVICSKIGQFGKGLDFKSLLKRVIRFIHRFLTEAVEKTRKDDFLPIFAPISRHCSG